MELASAFRANNEPRSTNYTKRWCEEKIAEHACLKYSGRIGRSALGKKMDEQAVRLAVIAHIRHNETNYDELLGRGWERSDARSAVADRVDEVLDEWEASES